MARRFSLMGRAGDTTVSWQEHNDAQWLPIIRQMLERGYKFFILTTDEHDVQQPVEVADISQVQETRRISLPDKVLEALIADAVLTIGGTLLGTTTGDRATTPEEVAENDTLVVPPAQGG